MISVIVDVAVTCLEVFYFFFLVNKEATRGNKRNQLVLFGTLAMAIIFMSYCNTPLLVKLLVQFLIILLVGNLIYQINFFKMGVYATIHILVMFMSESIVIELWNFFSEPVFSINIIYEDFRISLIIVAKAVHFFVIVIIERIMRSYRGEIEWTESIPIIFSGLSFLIVMETVNINIVHLARQEDKIFVLGGDIAVLIAFIINVIFTEHYFKVKRNAEEGKNKLMQLQLQYEYYQKKKEDEQYVRKIYHDLKNHLLLLDSESLHSEVSNRLKKFENYYETGNDFLDIIISDKIQRASEKGIKIECDVNFAEGIFMDPLDISTIFGNLLDNAIEATENLVENEKYIFCKVKKEHQLLVILIENYRTVLLEKNTKKNSFLHGFGLKNVQDAVRKYGGEYYIDKKNNMFRISIALPIPKNNT